MKPIPTSNAMKPAPSKGIESFPTPVIKDTVIIEVVNAWKGDYIPLEYGTKWDDIPHASVQGSFPDHKLISQSPNSEDGQWVKRIWANDRVDQDTYNYAIKYSGGSDAHPIYIRTYLLPRASYTPVQDLSPDPLFPSALLVDEEVTRAEGEFDSRYVQVTRVYETLPGPIISSQRVNERGDLETIDVQSVDPNTPPDPDGLFVTQTQVIKEDVSKGKKTTATVPSYSQLLIKEKKEGLLGETVTTDDIVDPSTQPDELSQSVVASTVQQTSATKAVKRTTTASGPTSLTKKSRDGKLLGNITSTQSIVAPSENPDSPSTSILSSEVSQTDSGKAIKTNVVLNSTPTLTSRENKGGLLGETTSTESIVPAGTQADSLSQTIVSSAVESIDSVRSRKITVTSSGPNQLTGKRINERGDLETIQESIVPAGTNAGPDGFLVVSSDVQPIDSAKSKLTTTTVGSYATLVGGQNKSGLLGLTFISESIVPPDSQPDQLSFTGGGGVIESSVTPISATKAKKTTVFGSGASFQLSSLVDSPTGLVKGIIRKEIVGTSTQPVGSTNILKDSIQPLDYSKSERELITVQTWPENVGVEYDEQLGIGIYYKEKIVDPSEYINPGTWTDLSNKSYKPIDQWKSIRRYIDKEKISAALLEQYYKLPINVRIDLPDKLKKIVVYWGKSYGEGQSWTADEGSASGSFSLSQSGYSKNSASVNGDIYFEIEKGFSGAVDGLKHIFFLKLDDGKAISSSDVLTTLNKFSGSLIPTYQQWPYIVTKTENLVLITGSKSETFNKSQSEFSNINGFGKSGGCGSSIDVDVSARSINIPQTLHGPIIIEQQSVGEIPQINPPPPDEFCEFVQTDLTPTYAIRPQELETTKVKIKGIETDASQFPTGNFLYSSDVSLYKWGFVKVEAITVNITSNHV